MTKLIAVTDIHIRPTGETIIGIDPYGRFCDALDHARRRHPDAAHLILMGDLAHSGQPQEYARIREALDGYPIPVTLMAGNHDHRDHLLAALPQPTDENGFLQTVIDTPTHRVICIDTLFGPPFIDYAHFGAYCDKRFAWLEERLAETTLPVLLLSHHPPVQIGFPGLDQIRLRDDQRMADLLARYPIAHMICGHVHRLISGQWRGTGFTILKSTCHQSPMDLEKTSMNLSTPEPAAYGIILLRPDSVIVHSEDYELAQDNVEPSSDAAPDPGG